MNKERIVSTFEYLFGFLLLGIFLLFQYKGSFSYDEKFLFIEIMLAYVWVGSLLVFAKVYFGLNFFEPITIIAAIYIGIFIIKPIIDLRNDDLYEHGIAVIGGGTKATLLFAVGFTAFFIAYYLPRKTWTYNGRPLFVNERPKEGFTLLQKQSFLVAAWAVTFALCLIGMMSQGLTLRYIFSFGWEGERVVDESKTALLFLSNFGITLVTLWLLIIDRVGNMWIKIITTVLCIVYILMRNARWLMLVFIAAPVTLYYLKRGKQPRLHRVMVIFVLALIVFSWMQINRNVLHSGGAMQGWGRENMTMTIVLKPLDSDFSTYRSFYSMVNRYPSEHDYLFGSTFAYVFILFIPKSIWINKPDNPVRDMIEIALNAKARKSGTAVANIGEMYANFGVLGIIFGMAILGRVAAKLKENMQPEADNTDKLAFYSIMFPLLFQWIARGNFSGNVYLTAFAAIPFIVALVFEKTRGKAMV